MTPWVHNNRISVSQSVDRIVELWSRSLQKFTWADRISFLSAISTSIMLTAYNDNRDSTRWSTCTRLHGQKLCKAGRQNTIMLLVLVTCGCLIKWLDPFCHYGHIAQGAIHIVVILLKRLVPQKWHIHNNHF